MVENNGLAKLEAMAQEQTILLHQILDVLVDISFTLKHGKDYQGEVKDYSDENLFGEIPMRAVNALAGAAGVATFGDLVKMTSAEVKAVSGIGEVTYNKINRALEWRKLKLMDG